MANTVTGPTILVGGTAASNHTVVHMHVTSDGTQMTNTALFTGVNATKGAIQKVIVGGKHSGVVKLVWDDTGKTPVLSVSPSSGGEYDFSSFGGIKNPNNAGSTGGVSVTTVGMASGDAFFITLIMRS